ncbi:MAG: glycosyltransferase family 2 protein [Bryobacteraceae bacterium]
MRSAMIQKLSIAAPAYNEAAGLEAVVMAWIEGIRPLAVAAEFEIVVCNDGSKDATGDILRRIAGRYPLVRPVHHTVNQGAAAALATAIANTTGDWVLLMDSDGQYPVRNLVGLWDVAQRRGSRAVIGVRRGKKDSLFTRFGSWASGALCNLAHRTDFDDFNCALKLIEGPLARSLRLDARGLNYSADITSRLIESGVGIAEAPVEHAPRVAGVSSGRAWRSARDRFLFVAWLAMRQALIRKQVLRRHGYDGGTNETAQREPRGTDAGSVTGGTRGPVLRREGIEHDHPRAGPLASSQAVTAGQRIR